MKNRIIFLLALSASISCGYAVRATSPNMAFCQSESLDTPPGEKIMLLGDLMLGINPNAIEASVTEDAVYIQFNQSFGNVSISLYNASNNLIYNGVVDTSMQQFVVIPFTSSVSGTYTVTLNNATGYAEGEFNKD